MHSERGNSTWIRGYLKMEKIKAFIKLLRPELLFAAGVCVIIGEIITLRTLPSFPEAISGFLWGFLLAGPAMTLNDLFDIEVDKINDPKRPLPSGLLSVNTVVIFTAVMTLIGIIVSFFISNDAVILYLFFWVIGFLYNWKLKEFGLLGNLSVSSSVAVTIVLGALVVGDPWNKTVLIFTLIIFLFNLGEEIAADAMDIEGDKKRNIKSIAILYGVKTALRFSTLLFISVIILSFLPFLWGIFGIDYLIIVSLMDILILVYTIKLRKSTSKETGHNFIRKIYLSGLLGMILIIISMFIT